MSNRKHAKGLQMQSSITPAGQVELKLVTVETPAPAEDELIVRVEAAPINPSDLGVLFGPADMGTVRDAGTPDNPVATVDISESAMKLGTVAARVDDPWAVGNEGAGVVVETGSSDAARALLGRTVAFMGRPAYTQYRCIRVDDCLVLPEGVTPAEAASSFINPLTAIGMVETMRMEGHTALVHTVGASNLGQMLIKLCRNEGVELVNIVRKPEQVELLQSLGANHICNSSSPTFTNDLTEALAATGATLAFDAIGGGKLASRILDCMEVAANRSAQGTGVYGTAIHKQVYIYGGLDRAPTEIRRTFGMAWGVGGWLLPYFLEKVGPGKSAQLKQKVADEIRTTFASAYTKVISLKEALRKETIESYARQATGEKYLIDPNRDV